MKGWIQLKKIWEQIFNNQEYRWVKSPRGVRTKDSLKGVVMQLRIKKLIGWEWIVENRVRSSET